MKAIFKSSHLLLLAITGILSLTVVSCKKDDPVVPPAPTTIVDVASSLPNFTILVAAVAKAGLVADLSSVSASLTVFAPVNDAFIAAGYPSVEYINNSVTSVDDIAKLKAILLYHVLGSKIPSSGITSVATAAETLNNKALLYATKKGSDVFINGVKVVIADVPASNGVIHAIGKILTPPAGTLLATAVALGANTSATGFSLLVAAVLKADAALPAGAVTAALGGAGPLTVFAPTNQAFIDAGFPTVASIQAADPAVLRNIILYHVVPARVFSSDLAAGEVTTVQGGKVTIALPAAGPIVLGLGNAGTASAVTAADFVATNGVIHVINRVLLP